LADEIGRDLLEQARQGDPDAFSVLVERYSARLYGACFNYLDNRQDAEDCVQETFVKAYRSIRDYHFLSSIYTWLYRIAVNTCLDFKRKTGRAIVYSLDEAMETEDSQVYSQFADPSPLPDELAETAEDRQMIRQEINNLPVFLREILILRDLEGMSYHDLSGLLRISEGTVKSRLSRARCQLVEKIGRREQIRGNGRLTDKSIGSAAKEVPEQWPGNVKNMKK
jgi:RNA polymerase sigma-70 factor (ECF subfamily)